MSKIEIKKLRKKSNLTQEKFAVLVGVSIFTIKNWESGKNKPSKFVHARLQKLSKKFFFKDV